MQLSPPFAADPGPVLIADLPSETAPWLVCSTATPRLPYVAEDELGNVTHLTDQNGQVLERYEYEGYGKFRIFDPNGNALSTSAHGWNRLFQGREYIPMLDAYDFRARTLWPELGRFGQEDPARSDPRLSLYQGLNGNWSNFIDPTGRYALDFHFYAVYFVARAQGFDRGLSGDVAWASQSVDTNPLTNPLRADALHLRAFHFLAPGRNATRRDNSIANRLASDAAASGNAMRFGIVLHVLADTFAHEGFSGYWDNRNLRSGMLSQAASFGVSALEVAASTDLQSTLPGHIGEEDPDSPDQPWRDVDKAIEASRRIYDFMGQFGPRYYGRPTAGRDFSNIEDLLRKGFRARGSETQRSAAWQALIKREFGDDTLFSGESLFGSRRHFDLFLQDQFRRAQTLLEE